MTLPFVFFVLYAQGGKPVHLGHKASANVIEDATPVTQKEAAQAFSRLAGFFQKVNDVPLGAITIPTTDKPATRVEVVAEMDRLYRMAAPAIRFTPAPIRHNSFDLRIDVSQKLALDRLVGLGLVARVGPLAVGPTTTLSPKEFGDAVGLFMARLTQMSHLPSPKWTPMLKSD